MEKSIDEMLEYLFDKWDYVEVGKFASFALWFCRSTTDEGLGGAVSHTFEATTPTVAIEKAYQFMVNKEKQ